jgi:hypothetical protein
MSWAKNYVLVPDASDKSVQSLAKAMAKRYAVPPQNCFADVAFDSFQKESADCVQSDLSTKLIVCAHGCKFGLSSNLDANGVATYLKKLGVSSVGLVAFKACEVGKDSFLDDLSDALDKNQISFGYLIAYKGSVWKASGGRMRGFWGSWEIKGKDKDRVRIVQGKAHVAAPGPRYVAHMERLHAE